MIKKFYDVIIGDTGGEPSMAESLIEGAKEIGKIMKHNIDTADKIHDLYKELPDCPLKEHLSLWFEYKPKAQSLLSEKDKEIERLKGLLKKMVAPCDCGDCRYNWEQFKQSNNIV